MPDSITRRLTIMNKKGLHARAAAKFVRLVGEFQADVRVSKDGETVGGTSIMGLMMLAAARHSVIEVTAEGRDAIAVMEALASLVMRKFEED